MSLAMLPDVHLRKVQGTFKLYFQGKHDKEIYQEYSDS